MLAKAFKGVKARLAPESRLADKRQPPQPSNPPGVLVHRAWKRCCPRQQLDIAASRHSADLHFLPTAHAYSREHVGQRLHWMACTSRPSANQLVEDQPDMFD